MDIHQDTSTSSPVHQQLSPSSPLDAASASASAPPRATTKNSETKQNKTYTHHCVHVHNDGHPLVPSSFLPVDLPPPPLPFWSRVRHEVSIIPMSSLPNHENCRQPDSCSESVRVDRPAPMTDPSLSAASVSDDSSSAVTVRSSNTLLLSLPPPSSATAPVHEGFRAAVSSADESSSHDEDVLRSSTVSTEDHWFVYHVALFFPFAIPVVDTVAVSFTQRGSRLSRGWYNSGCHANTVPVSNGTSVVTPTVPQSTQECSMGGNAAAAAPNHSLLPQRHRRCRRLLRVERDTPVMHVVSQWLARHLSLLFPLPFHLDVLLHMCLHMLAVLNR